MSEPRPEPPSLKWVARFIDSMNRASVDGIYSWELTSRTDPLQWVLTVTMRQRLGPKAGPLFRALLREWAEANDAVYKRSTWNKNTFTALILVKGLGPEKNLSPFEGTDAGHRRRRGRVRRFGWAHRGGSRDDDDPVSPAQADAFLADVLGEGLEENDETPEGPAGG